MLLLVSALAMLGCIRPSDRYDVGIVGDGVSIDDVQPAPSEMGGAIEYARVRFWGHNLGAGLTGPFGDQPRADGTEIVTGQALFGYPRDPAFDRASAILSPGPRVGPNEDGCFVRVDTGLAPAVSEYVDVGDAVSFVFADGAHIDLPRDPARFPEPAGDAWFVGYGGAQDPVVRDHALLPDTWRSGAVAKVTFPGGLPPETATVGSIPTPPGAGVVTFPAALEDPAIGGVGLRAPHHGYDESGVWVGEDAEDPVRYPGPWTEPLELTWTPSESGEPLTVVVRILGYGAEADCLCGEDCGAGFTCDQGVCAPEEGSGWVVVGELACTAADDGAFTITPDMAGDLLLASPWWETAGAVLAVGRMSEGELVVPDVRTQSGRRVPVTPVRTRVSDITWTRLEAP